MLSAQWQVNRDELPPHLAGGRFEDLHFHDLRHEGTSRLFEAGLTIEQVPLVSRHKDWKMRKRYTQLRPENLYALLSRRA